MTDTIILKYIADPAALDRGGVCSTWLHRTSPFSNTSMDPSSSIVITDITSHVGDVRSPSSRVLQDLNSGGDNFGEAGYVGFQNSLATVLVAFDR